MARTQEDVERFLELRGHAVERLEDGTLLVSIAAGQPPAVVRVDPPLVVIQVNVGEVGFQDPAKAADFYRRLLELNETDLLHAAYGLANNRVVLSAALALENLDDNELGAALADVSLALTEHVPGLRQMASDKVGG
jgi:hypothetical protein